MTVESIIKDWGLTVESSIKDSQIAVLTIADIINNSRFEPDVSVESYNESDECKEHHVLRTAVNIAETSLVIA